MIRIAVNKDNYFLGDFLIEGVSDDDYETLCSALFDIVGNALLQGFDPNKIKEALRYAETPIMFKEKREQVRKLRS